MPLFQRKLGRMLAALDKAMSTFRGHSRKACALRCRIFYSLAKIASCFGACSAGYALRRNGAGR